MTLFRLETMFPNELDARLRDVPALIVPFGTIEWHSHHLPVGLDGMTAAAWGEGAAEASGAVLAPVGYWAVGGVPYPYTLNLSSTEVEPLMTAAFIQFGAMGFRTIVAVSGHFGLEQTLAIKRAALSAMRVSPATVWALTAYDLITDLWTGDHAAIGETALMQAIRPDLVRLDAVDASVSLDGVLGKDPRGQATAAFGRDLLASLSARTAALIARSLDEPAVARARYIEALEMTVRILSQLFAARQTQPKSAVPGVTTAAYLEACQAFASGDYAAAKAALERKLADLKQ